MKYIEGFWRIGVVGNIVQNYTDETGTVRNGTESFSGGTTVYLGGKGWDNSEDTIGVIGKNQFGRFVVDCVPIVLIENIRVKRIHHSEVLILIEHLECLDQWPWWDQSGRDYRETRSFVKAITQKISELKQDVRPENDSSTASEPTLSMPNNDPGIVIHIVVRPNQKENDSEPEHNSLMTKDDRESARGESQPRKKWFRRVSRR